MTTTQLSRPQALTVDPGNIPAELRALPRWVVWDWHWIAPEGAKPGRWTKVPLAPAGQRRASSTDPNTWATFDAALARSDRDGLPGVGFVFTTDDPHLGIDLDKCRDPRTGEIDAWARVIIDDLASFTELSPSGTGVHIIMQGKLPDGAGTRRRTGAIEMYENGRYFTVTGHRLTGTPATVERRQDALDRLYAKTFAARPNEQHEPRPSVGGSAVLTDEDVITSARDARNGSKFLALWGGDTREYAGDDSAADLALLSILTFWTQDRDQLDRLFRRSGLMREKWERADYRERTIGRALERSDVWEPAPPDRGPAASPGNGHRPEDMPPTVVTFPAPKPVIATPWPELDEAALTGLAGDVVRAIDPHTEGDKAATLINFLVMFGSAVGASPHALVGDRQHRANEFAVLVGDTARGRKGTSHDTPQAIIQAAASDGDWAARVQGGLSSGEGLVWAVRDPIEETRKGEQITVDPGVVDKRLLAVEEEFSAVLRVAGRDGSTLSETMRRAWDGRPLQILTKNKGASCGSPHISILGHVTRVELQRELTDVSAGNGLANRFLWVCVKRSKLLPEGGALADAERNVLIGRTRRAISAARKIGTVRRDDQARALWAEIYGDLSEPGKGLLGAITSRAEAHVLRLSVIYALLDCSAVITTDHLIAALAVWDYCAASAKYVFGDATGDPIADRILTALRANGGPMGQSEVVDLLGRNVNQGRLGKALETLITGKLARCYQSPQVDNAGRKIAGRPTTLWVAA